MGSQLTGGKRFVVPAAFASLTNILGPSFIPPSSQLIRKLLLSSSNRHPFRARLRSKQKHRKFLKRAMFLSSEDWIAIRMMPTHLRVYAGCVWLPQILRPTAEMGGMKFLFSCASVDLASESYPLTTFLLHASDPYRPGSQALSSHILMQPSR